MGRYRYQIFDTVDTRLRADGIDTCKQNRCVSILARAAHTVCAHARFQPLNLSAFPNRLVVCDFVMVSGGDSEAGSFSLIMGGASVSPVTAEK